jgi:hypothetical protein
MAHYEDWFKALWNACIDAMDDMPEAKDNDHPFNGVVETMHGIAEGEEEMWLALPPEEGEQPEPILNKYPDY